MCGIVGVINRYKNTKPLCEEALLGLKRAMEVQKHRGPDDSGVCGFRADTRGGYMSRRMHLASYL